MVRARPSDQALVVPVEPASSPDFDPSRIAATLTRVQHKALGAIDRPYGRVRWMTDRWNLSPIVVNGVRIAVNTQESLIDLGLIWAKKGSIGYLALGKEVRKAIAMEARRGGTPKSDPTAECGDSAGPQGHRPDSTAIQREP